MVTGRRSRGRRPDASKLRRYSPAFGALVDKRPEARRGVLVGEVAVVAGRREIGDAPRLHRIDRLRDDTVLEIGLIEVADVVRNDLRAGGRERRMPLAKSASLMSAVRKPRFAPGATACTICSIARPSSLNGSCSGAPYSVQAGRLLEHVDTGRQRTGGYVGRIVSCEAVVGIALGCPRPARRCRSPHTRIAIEAVGEHADGHACAGERGIVVRTTSLRLDVVALGSHGSGAARVRDIAARMEATSPSAAADSICTTGSKPPTSFE